MTISLDRAAAPVFVLLLSAFVAGGSWWAPFDRLDRFVYDLNLRLFARAPLPTIRIIAIDDKSLKALGRWPWPRRLHAALVDRLTDAGVDLIVYDIVFSDPDRNDPEGDDLLAEAFARHGRVILPVAVEENALGGLPIEVLPLPALADAALALGHADVELSPDGIVRRIYLKAGIGTARWPALGLALREHLGNEPSHTLPGDRPPPGPAPPPYAWVRDFGMLIPFGGPPPHFPRSSFVDALTGAVSDAELKGAVVLIGVTASTLTRGFAVPAAAATGEAMPGIELQAHVFDSLAQGRAIVPLDRRPVAVGCALAAALLATVIVTTNSSRLWLLSVLTVVAVHTAWLRFGWLWFGPSALLVALIMGFPLWIWRRAKLAQRWLLLQREQADITLSSIADGVITLDEQRAVTYLNGIAAAMTGWSPEQARGQPFSAVFNGTEEATGAAFIPALARDGDQSVGPAANECHVCLRGADQRDYVLRVTCSRLIDNDGRRRGTVVAFCDITQQRRLSRLVEYQATHDALTQLPNRVLLFDRLSRAIVRARRSGHSVAVMFIDLDRMKTVNDTFGHAAGDAVLRSVSARLEAAHRRSDTIARFGGDEFVIVLEDINPETGVSRVAETILAAFHAPFIVEGVEIVIGVSIGVSLYPEHGASAEAMLRTADVAMYAAKEQGGNGFHLYSSESRVRTVGSWRMEQHLRRALDRGELELHYQPQQDLISGSIVGAEVLLRWRRQADELVFPDNFVPLAEDTGLIVPIGTWVLETAFRRARAWREGGLAIGRIMVNLAPQQFLRSDFVPRMETVLGETGVDPHSVGVELTENMIIKDVEKAAGHLRALRAMALDIAIDDFGMGFTSIGTLKRLPIDRLKIDKMFIRDAATQANDASIVQAMILMAHSMGLRVVAEGVETEGQCTLLRRLQCDQIQGYHLSPPLPEPEFLAFLAAQRPQPRPAPS
jgi:diguanylate cyclase (GGDEF)-like protein/PAS domain S-box-containing protein